MKRESRRPARDDGSEYQTDTTDVLSHSKSSREAERPPRILATHWFRADELEEAA